MPLALCLASSVSLAVAQDAETGASLVSGIAASGGASIPLGSSSDYFIPGFFIDAGPYMEHKSGLGAGIKGVYSVLPLIAEKKLSLLGAGLEATYNLDFTSMVSLSASAGIGAYSGSLVDDRLVPLSGVRAELGGMANAGLKLAFSPVPFLSLYVTGRYFQLFGLYQGGTVGAGLAYTFGKTAGKGASGADASPAAGQATRTDLAAKGLALGQFEMESLYPVFYKYYNAHPYGKLTLRNNEKKAVENVKLSYTIKQFMDAPTVLLEDAVLEAGQSLSVPVHGLFNDAILTVTEGTLVVAEFAWSYTINGKPENKTITSPIRILDRNSMSWFDDRCAAAYVTAKDPAVLNFSKNIIGTVIGREEFTLDRGLQAIVAIHTALEEYGLNYIVDPKSSYAALSADKGSIDFLQFPRQTLEYRSGDCDDLSILYSALLEASGLETAFITTPGHIFMAVALDMDEAATRKSFPVSNDFIFMHGKVWLPLEITERRGGFIKAWKSGIAEWRESLAKGEAQLLPVRDAWKDFEPVAMPGTSASIAPPRGDAFNSRYDEVIRAVVERELGPRESQLLEEIKKTQGSPKARNSLGILYARYGLYNKAEEAFLAILQDKPYLPALVNLGNVEFIQRRYAKAMEYFSKAYALQKTSLSAVMGLLLSNYELGDQAAVARHYKEIETLDPSAAAEFSYAVRTSPGEGRASAPVDSTEVVQWTE